MPRLLRRLPSNGGVARDAIRTAGPAEGESAESQPALGRDRLFREHARRHLRVLGGRRHPKEQFAGWVRFSTQQRNLTARCFLLVAPLNALASGCTSPGHFRWSTL